ncbi:MAG: ThiF family adenylyltransferase, partial [Phycisphaerae bacterium]|nr:ThiF family adenylyltransferase [Phycisphaerae bacterium]
MKKKFSVALSTQKHDVLTKHLLRNPGNEDLCFALWKPSEGHTRYTGLITEIVLPLAGDRNLHVNASFNPKYFERVLRMAAEKDAGIIFLHSHLTPGWQGMSFDDVQAELQMAGSVFAVTSLPLIGMTVGTDGAWSARRWDKTASRKFDPTWAVSVRTVGDILNATFYDKLMPRPKFKEDFARTLSAWGDEAQARLMRLHVVVVGVGSVGSVVAEALAMMGVQRITLIDFDIFKKINRDRSVGVTKNDLGKSKVSVIASHLEKVATADDFQVKTVDYSIVELEGFLAAL